jgi:hypothetical protein
MKVQFKYIKPFLILLDVLPDKLYDIKDEKIIDVSSIIMDDNIIEKLRTIKNG